MRLEGSGGALELTIRSYQFPNADNWHDRNWLIVAATVTTPENTWSFVEPCLLTSEAQHLASWLGQITEPSFELRPIAFTEPNLQLEVIEQADPLTVRVHFELEARPVRLRDSEDDFYLDLVMSASSLRKAGEAFAAELAAFPVVGSYEDDRPMLVNEVVSLVNTLLEPYGPDAAVVFPQWAARAGMWFVEVAPRREGAAKVSVGIDDRGEFLVSFGHTHFELWRPKQGPPEVGVLGEILAALFAGNVEEAGFGNDRFARIALAGGRAKSVGAAHLPLPWSLRKRAQFEPYAD